jgi:integrase
LGVYPETSLAEAREKRVEARKLLAKDIDPSYSKKEAKRQSLIKAENTFEVIAREWHSNQSAMWTPRYSTYVITRLESDVFPFIGNRPIAEIKPPELLDVFRKIEKRGAQEIAHRTMQCTSQTFRYAIVTGRAERNPALDLKGALKPVKRGHYAALDVKELPEFVKCLNSNDARLYAHTRLAIRLMMLTFVRTGELINARWSEFDLDGSEWLIPAERMKMRNAHIVPLSSQAVALLMELKALTGDCKYVFSGSAGKPMSNNTILKALARLGYKGRATGHGFRALAMSAIKEKLGYRHEVVDRQLAHAPRSKVAAAYDRATFLDERREMMQEWADYLDELAE